ncbi:MAG: 3-oxoacyl-ACP reductase FabG [Solirubrobacteraceae bacterium]
MSGPESRASGCALITGGSRGIGAAIAQALAADGWRCGVNYRADADGAHAVVDAIVAAGGEAIAVQGDVADPAAIDTVFATLEEHYGSVLCVVNNAGIRMDGLGATLSDEAWSRVLRTNLDAAFMVSRRALSIMLRNRYGRIVNIASAAALRASPGQANYAASKAGLVAMTSTLAVEVARRGVTVNAVAPGFVQTQLTADVDSSAILEHVPARRAGTVGEVAACVQFLCSDGAAYVTGAVLPVDGGLTA